MPLRTTATPERPAAAAMLSSRMSPDGRCRSATVRLVQRQQAGWIELQVGAFRCDPDARRGRVAVFGDPHGKGHGAVEPLGQPLREAGADVLDDEDRDREVGRDREKRARICGPPVDEHMPITDAFATRLAARAPSRRARGWRITRAPPSSLTRRRKATAAASSGRAVERKRSFADRLERAGGERGGSALGVDSESEERTRIGVGRALMICSTASRPDIPGSSMSIVTSVGSRRGKAAIASSAVLLTPTTLMSPSCSSRRRSAAAYVLESSQMRTAGRRRARHRPTSRSTVSSRACWSKLRLTMYASAPASMPRRRSSSLASDVTITTGQSGARRVGADRRRQLEAVHLGHLEVGDHEVDLVVASSTRSSASRPSRAVSTR